MGLLDALRGLLGGRTNGRSPPGGNGNGSSGQHGGGEIEGDDPIDDPTDLRLQSHGTHWEVLLHDDGHGDWSEALQDLVMETAERGRVVEGGDRGGREVRGHRYGDGPLGTLVVTLDRTVATAYPVGEGVEHEVSLSRRVEWESGIEAWVGGDLGPASVDCFATDYFERPPEAFEGDCTVSLALLAYRLGPADEETVVDADGEELSLSGMAGFTPTSWGAVDDVSVRTTVTAVERVHHAGVDAYRVEAPLFRTDDEADVPVAVYVADHGLADGYVPSAGDDVAGVGWLQGRVV